MLSTSSKVAFGYLLLIGLLIGSIKYIYMQMTLLSEHTELETIINDRRQTTHNIISKLYEIEIISQTLHIGKSNQYQTFNKKMKEVHLSIDTLQTLLTDSIQRHRLDTLRALLKYKSNNMKAVTKALNQTPTDQIYQQQFDSLLIQQDSLLNSSHIRRRVITHRNTYTIHHKPKSLFKRIAAVFSPGKGDSTNVNNIIREELVDTLEEAYNPIDTIASMLTGIKHKVLITRQKELRKLDSDINKLRIAGGALSQRVNQLLETIENEEQEAIQRKMVQAQQIRNHAARTMATISIIAVILVLVFFTIIWHDLTRSNHYRKELEKSKLYAENLLIAREKLMLTITHDIKAPAGSIIGYLDLLIRLVKDKRQLFYLTNMQSSAQHLLNLVTSLLDFHRLEAGKMDLNPVSFNPYQLFEEIYHSFLPLAEKKGIQLHFQPEITPDTTLEGDPFRLRQIIENLISNALKFTSKGEITLRVAYRGNQFIFSVSDTGCGMTHEEQLRIFKEFTRLHSAQGQEGFGLGLSITRKLIDLQNGKITVDSTRGVGSTFTVSIPLPCFVLHKATPNKKVENHSLVCSKNLRFLLIDDDKIQLQLTEAMLHQTFETYSDKDHTHQLEIICCEEPEQVLTLLQKESFDMVFTDIQMPAMNGFELLDAIRKLKNPSANRIPIIAITARGDIDADGFKKMGFAGMLQKPFNQEDLRRLLTERLQMGIIEKESTKEEKDTNVEINDTDSPSNQSKVEQRFNFTPLFAFSEGDEEAAKEILSTFIQETEKNIHLLTEASKQQDMTSLGNIAHKMLPTFIMLEVTEAISPLQWLESKRNTTVYVQEADIQVEVIVRSAQQLLTTANSLL